MDLTIEELKKFAKENGKDEIVKALTEAQKWYKDEQDRERSIKRVWMTRFIHDTKNNKTVIGEFEGLLTFVEIAEKIRAYEKAYGKGKVFATYADRLELV